MASAWGNSWGKSWGNSWGILTSVNYGNEITLSFTDQKGAHWDAGNIGWLHEGPLSPRSHDVFMLPLSVETDQDHTMSLVEGNLGLFSLQVETGPEVSEQTAAITMYAPEVQGDVLQIGGMGLYALMRRPTLDIEFEKSVLVPAMTAQGALLEAVSDEWFRVDQTATSAQWTQYAPEISTSTEIMMETAHAELYGWMAVQNEGCGVDPEAVVESGTLHAPTVETS